MIGSEIFCKFWGQPIALNCWQGSMKEWQLRHCHYYYHFYYKLLQNWMGLHEHTNVIWAQLHTASSSLASVNWSVGYRLHTLPPFVLSPWPPLCCVEKKIVSHDVGNTPHPYILSFKKEREENYFKLWHTDRITMGCIDPPVVSLY